LKATFILSGKEIKDIKIISMKNHSFLTYLIGVLIISIAINSCTKLDPINVTKFSKLDQATQVSYNTAQLQGKLMDVGDEVVLYGHCWAVTPNPTISDFKTSSTGNPGKGVDFTSHLSNLLSGNTYYVRAYATTALNTVYSDEINFKTAELKDIENNVYKTVTIGAQVWMAENLKTTKYNNGDSIGTTHPATLDISAESTPKYHWAYNGDESNVSVYGRLYTWYAATDSRNICPAGWHVPTDAEWASLITNLGGTDLAGGKMKEGGIQHWDSPNTDATNSSGFTALAAGGRNGYTSFYNIGKQAYFWSSTPDQYSPDNYAWARDLSNISAGILNQSWFDVRGYSVRCLKD
jgi:uncharacterized protein (TIGR02145 family)